MATLQATTSSTRSRIDPEAKEQIKAIVDEYDFWGAHDEINIDVEEDSDRNTTINIYGYDVFDPTKPIYEDGEFIEEGDSCAEEFLKRIAPYLEEVLVIEMVGHEKARFPLLAIQWNVWPDGTVQCDSFDEEPDRVETSEQDDSQYGILDTEQSTLLKLGPSSPILISDREKAIEKAGGNDRMKGHLIPVRVEKLPVEDSEPQ